MAADGDTFITRAFEGDDEKVGVYSVSSGAAVRSLEGHTDQVTALSLDGDRLASGAADGTCRMWSLGSGDCFARVEAAGVIHGVALRGNYLCTGDAQDTAMLWQLGSGDASRLWNGFRSEDGSVIEASLPRVAKVGHAGSVYCVGVTAAGAAVSVGWNQTDLKIWDVAGTRHQITTAGSRASGRTLGRAPAEHHLLRSTLSLAQRRSALR